MNKHNLCLDGTFHFNDLEQESIDIGYLSSIPAQKKSDISHYN